ncbi:MAG: tetratricopeptide repeat protein [Spirochaetaceae bacterium]|jgi:tetratricopeptide (TPR) repeat protein|nr:tetratricopeptide repeat protein [Spirochaetaceae bacterium]
MKKRYILIPVISALCFYSCSQNNIKEIDEQTLKVYVRAQGLYAEGRFTESAAALDSEKRTKKFVPALVLRGKSLYFSGDHDGALEAFTKALKLRPAHTESSLYLARIYRERNQDKKAFALIEEILAGDPQNVRALRLAAGLVEAGNISTENSALGFLNRAVDSSGEYSLALLDRARLNWRGGRTEEALADLRTSKALISSSSAVYKTINDLEGVIRGDTHD